MRLEVKSLIVSGALLMSIYTVFAGVMLWLFEWPWNAAFAAVAIGMAAAIVILRARDVLVEAGDPDGAAPREAETP